MLAHLYQVWNEACVVYLRKQLESEHMNEGDPMDSFLTKIKDLKEQLIAIDEILPDIVHLCRLFLMVLQILTKALHPPSMPFCLRSWFLFCSTTRRTIQEEEEYYACCRSSFCC